MIRINLLADRHAKDRIIIQQQLVLGAVIILASLVLCGFWWNWKSGDIDAMNVKIDDAQRELEKQKNIRKKVKQLEARERRVNDILDAIDMLKDMRKGPVPYLDDMNVILPQEIWLTQVKDNGGRIEVDGYSFSNTAVAKLMKNMEESENFVNIELKEITKANVGGESLKKFTVQCMTAAARKLEEKKAEEEAKKKKAGKKKK